MKHTTQRMRYFCRNENVESSIRMGDNRKIKIKKNKK